MIRNQIYMAKRANLPSVLQSMGVSLTPEGNGYRLSDHDSLKFYKQNDIWLYKWWSKGGEVGDGIDYLQRYKGMEFFESVQTLSGLSAYIYEDQHKFKTPRHEKKSDESYTEK